jgi:hypothetical protein
VDSYVAGAELERALQQTRENMLHFSYTSLLETLPRSAVEVLECLFGVGEPVARSDIGYLLDVPTDHVADALMHLLRTSLLTRHSGAGVERYSLSSSVRDLLLRFPKDADVRVRVNARLREQRQLISAISRTDDVNTKNPLDWNYLPLSAPDHVKALAVKVFRALRVNASGDRLIQLLDELSSVAQHDSDEPVVFRAMAFILKKLNDRYGAVNALRRACSCSTSDPAAMLTLAELLRDEKQYDEAQIWSERLVQAGWDSPVKSSLEGAIRVIKAHWVVAIWIDKCDEAKVASQHWRTSGAADSRLRLCGNTAEIS